MPVRISKGDPISDVWALYHFTYQSVTKCADLAFADTPLTHQQYQILLALKDIPYTPTVTSIADWLDRNPNSITLIIDRMGKSGLVKRVRDLKDRRTIRLAVTPKGEKMFTQADITANQLRSEILSNLSRKELLTFQRLLQKVRERTFILRNIEEKVKNIK